MKRRSKVIWFIAVLFACFAWRTSLCTAQPVPCTAQPVTVPQALPTLSSADLLPDVPSEWIPHDRDNPWLLDPCKDPGIKKRLMDMYSWKTFIALSWPVSSVSPTPKDECDEFEQGFKSQLNGSAPDPKGVFPSEPRITKNNCPRWMTWHKESELYEEPRANAASGYAVQKLPETDLLGPQDGFPGETLSDSEVPADEQDEMKYPLIDQNDNKVYYDIRLNNGDYCGIKQFERMASDLPPNSYYLDWASLPVAQDSPPRSSVENVHLPGSTELKFAWKVLAGRDDPRHFITRTVQIPNKYRRHRHCGKKPSGCDWKEVDVGLVGMHIIHKSKDHTQWIWSTFEHVNNVPDESVAKSPDGLDKDYSFFGNFPACPHNVRPKANCLKTQLTRTEAIAPDTAELNSQVQRLLKGSVLQYYELIGTQYDPKQTPDPAWAAKLATPPLLRNTVIEPYLPSKSSCIGCHSGAKLHKSCYPYPDGYQADFSFVLARIRCPKPSSTPLPAHTN